MSAQPESYWSNYYEALSGAEPHWTLITALMNFERDLVTPTTAVDLGCGQGRDVVEMLQRGWSVIAVDSDKSGLDRLRASIDPQLTERLETVEQEMESYSLPPVAFVNASLSLPFCRPDRFHAIWRQVIIQLEAGGRFAGHFFGERDDWSSSGQIIHYTSRQLKNILYGFQIEMFSETESDFPTVTGEIKHWHIFQVVAKKPKASD